MNTSEPPPPPFPVPQVVRWRWWIHLLIIGLYSPLLGLLSVGNDPGHGPMLTSSATGVIVVCAVELALFAFVFFLGWVASRATATDMMWPWRGGFSVIPLAAVYSVLLRMAVGIAIGATAAVLILNGFCTEHELRQFVADHRPKVEKLVDPSAMKRNPVYFWLQLTLVSFVLGGLREELWRSAVFAGMQKLWPRCFESRLGWVAAAAIAAVLFAIGHWPQGMLGVLTTGLLGFGLGIIMLAHRCIWHAVLAHGIFDATSMALLPWVMEHMHLFQQATPQ